MFYQHGTCAASAIVTDAYDQAAGAAGFDYEIELWTPGKEGCCLTRVTEKSL